MEDRLGQAARGARREHRPLAARRRHVADVAHAEQRALELAPGVATHQVAADVAVGVGGRLRGALAPDADPAGALAVSAKAVRRDDVVPDRGLVAAREGETVAFVPDDRVADDEGAPRAVVEAQRVAADARDDVVRDHRARVAAADLDTAETLARTAAAQAVALEVDPRAAGPATAERDAAFAGALDPETAQRDEARPLEDHGIPALALVVRTTQHHVTRGRRRVRFDRDAVALDGERPRVLAGDPQALDVLTREDPDGLPRTNRVDRRLDRREAGRITAADAPRVHEEHGPRVRLGMHGTEARRRKALCDQKEYEDAGDEAKKSRPRETREVGTHGLIDKPGWSERGICRSAHANRRKRDDGTGGPSIDRRRREAGQCRGVTCRRSASRG